MRIPLYQSQVAPTSEAPGRPITTRHNANTAVQSELAKAKPISTALTEIGEFARVRYEMARDNLLNEATLGADEKIFEAFNEMKESSDFNRVLDGENPLWNQRVEKIKTDLLKTLGKDRYSNDKFNAYFNQSELRHRFKLRGVIDTKVKQAQIEYSNMKNAKYNENHGNKDVNFEEALKDLALLDNDAKSQARLKAQGKSFFPYKNGSKKVKATFEITAFDALYDKVTDPNNVSNVQVLQNVHDAVFKGESNADNSGVTKMLKRIIEVDGVDGKKTVEKIISQALQSATRFDKMSGTLQSDLSQAQKQDLSEQTATLNAEINNIGDPGQNIELLGELALKAQALSKLAADVGTPTQRESLKQLSENLSIKSDQALISDFWKESIGYGSKVKFYKSVLNGEDLNHEYGLELNWRKVNTSTNEGAEIRDHVLSLMAAEDKKLKDAQGDIVSYALDNELALFVAHHQPRITWELLAGKADDKTKKELSNYINFAREAHQRFSETSGGKINYLPQGLATQIKTAFFDESTDLGDLAALKSLQEHFEPLGVFDEVLEQLGMDEPLFVVAELLTRGGETNEANASIIMKGLRSIKNYPGQVNGPLKNLFNFTAPLNEVLDGNQPEQKQAADWYAKAAQAYLVAESAQNPYKYTLSPDEQTDPAVDNIKAEKLVDFSTDLERAIQIVTGQVVAPDGTAYGGVQTVYGEKGGEDAVTMLVPTGFTKEDVQIFMRNFTLEDLALAQSGEKIDENLLKRIREGEGIRFLPVVGPETGQEWRRLEILNEVDEYESVELLTLDNKRTGNVVIIDFNSKALEKLKKVEAYKIAKDLEFTLDGETYESLDAYKLAVQADVTNVIKSNVGMALYQIGIESDLIASFAGSEDLFKDNRDALLNVDWVELPDEKKQEFEALWEKHKGTIKGTAQAAWGIAKDLFIPNAVYEDGEFK